MQDSRLVGWFLTCVAACDDRSRNVKVTVILSNVGGEIDRRTVKALALLTCEEKAKAAAIEMIEALPYLSVGDTIRIIEGDGE